MSGIPTQRHFLLDKPTPGKFRIIFGRYGGKYRWEFDTFGEAVGWVELVQDSDEQYIAYIENPDGQIVHDHQDPFAGWVPPLPAVVEGRA